jgi:hypothetical protein
MLLLPLSMRKGMKLQSCSKNDFIQGLLTFRKESDERKLGEKKVFERRKYLLVLIEVRK